MAAPGKNVVILKGLKAAVGPAVDSLMMVVPYQWKLENVDKAFKTMASHLILFRGEKVFRVALKNSENSQSTLIFLAVNLNKMGLQVSDVVCGKEGVDTHCKMNENKPRKKNEEIPSDQNIMKSNPAEGILQFFTSQVDVVNGENLTFVFQIHLKGIVDGYSYHPCDRLAKEQFWSSINNKLHADVEFIVQDKRFTAHKAILAARSPVFRAEFIKQESKKDNPHQIQIYDVDASSFEQFLYFVYTGEFLHFSFTGEPAPKLVNKDLLKLAELYHLKTLENLCRVALREVNADQMVSFTTNLRSGVGQETNLKIRSEMLYILYFKETYYVDFTLISVLIKTPRCTSMIALPHWNVSGIFGEFKLLR